MSYKKPYLILYDIDGTLVRLDKTGRWIYQKALCEVLGKEVSIESIDWIGTTDIEIIHKVIEENGFSGRDSVRKMYQVFERITYLFREIIRNSPQSITILPFAYETSEWTYNNYYNCLLTGNIREVAYMKLSPFGLDKFFPVGSFGDEKKERAKLVPIALNRASEYYKISFEKVFIVGDSHRDIIAAKENGIPSIIVTTGKMKKEELEKYTPDYIIPSLKELPDILLNHC
ncbi:MAG: HAD family hydrolase [Spirochaetia bacterium]|nr:HAD hydrolase-like protein [Spirochaetota bacterium]MCX8096575.1 HAD hydrolase-like protein [Spirochaetota bacterium]MDW8112871.1 HAD family hydrolase [Spirochaetia bacterium]